MRVKERVKTIILLSISICLAANSMTAQTIIGEKIIDGVYYVTENIIVTEGAKLEIKPGSVLNFSPGKSIRVDGLLTANGTPDDPISFILNPNESNGVWHGIHFTINAKLAIIENCIFKNTGRNADTRYGTLSFSTDKIPVISGCIFSDIHAGAIIIENFVSVESIAIHNNTFESFSPFAIAISSGLVRNLIKLTSNSFKDNAGTLSQVIHLSYVNSPNLELNDNLFQNINGELNNTVGSGQLIQVDQTNIIDNIKVYGDQVIECFNLSAGYSLYANYSADFLQILIEDITSSQTFISTNTIAVQIKNSEFRNISPVGNSGGGAFSVNFTKDTKPGTIIIDNTNFINCDSKESDNIAGAISITGWDISSVLIDKTTITQCQSLSGSGINISVNSLGSFSFTNSHDIGSNSANSGGLININVSNLIDQFVFSYNKVDKLTTDSIVASTSNGGLINLEAAGLNNFIFNNNSFNRIRTKGQGGVIYLDCSDINSITAKNNDINSIESGESGGFIYVNQSGNNPIDHIQIDSNTIDEINVLNGNGGLLSLNSVVGANIIKIEGNSFENVICDGYGGLLYLGNQGFYPDISISSNIFKNTLYTNGGGLLFSNGSISSSKNSYNTIKVTSNNSGVTAIAKKESGALIYLRGNFSPGASSFVVKRNISNSLIARKSGGGIWFEGKIANKCTVEFNQVKAITQSISGNGGFLYLKSSVSDSDNDITISHNEIESAIAKQSGGAFYIDQAFGRSISISNNALGSCYAESFGGVFYLSGALQKSLSLVDNTIGKSQALSGGTGYINSSIGSINVSGNTILEKSKAQLDGFLEFEGDFEQVSIIDNTINLLEGNRVAGISIVGSISGKIVISNNTITKIDGPGFGFAKIDNREEELALPELAIIGNSIGTLNTGNSGFLCYEGQTDIHELNILSTNFSGDIINIGDNACFYIKTDDGIGTLDYSNNTMELSGKLFVSKKAPAILQTISRELGSATFSKNIGHSTKSTDPSLSTLYNITASDGIGAVSIIEDNYKDFSCSKSGGIYSISTPKVNYFQFLNNSFDNIQTIGKGAILCMNEVRIDSLISENNIFKNIFSSDNGGAINLSGELMNITLKSDVCINNRTYFNGGTYCFESNKNGSCLEVLSISGRNKIGRAHV